MQYKGSLVYVVDGARRRNKRLCRGCRVRVTRRRLRPRALLDFAPILVPGCVVLAVEAPEAGSRELKSRRIRLLATGCLAGRPAVCLGARA